MPEVVFAEYRLDLDVPRLQRGGIPVPIQPRPLAVLCYLAARPGVVIGREELIRSVWAGTHVTRAVLKVAVRALREALGDSAESPRYVETVGREGYRFISTGAGASRGTAAVAPMVGRARELTVLERALADVVAGACRIVFVTGEAGIGKTTLIDAFLGEVRRAGAVWIARGQCLEQYGEGEAYLPVLEAVGRLVRDDAGGEVAATLRRHAPTWAAELPAVVPRVARDAMSATTPARMLRELTDVLEVLGRQTPLVLALEDLQWSDVSTVDVIRAIGRRRPPARLLLIASIRPTDKSAPEPPIYAVQKDLVGNDRSVTLVLPPLSVDDVGAYLDRRFVGLATSAAGRALAARIHERTSGNALFVVNVASDLVTREVLVRHVDGWRVEGRTTERIPAGLRELLGHRLRRLERETRRVLEVASVAGDEFVVASVAAALGSEVEPVEGACETLAAEGQLLAETGVAEWADGTISGRYRFRHALYREALYEGIGASRRVRLHRAIGLREEAGHGARAGDHAVQLAMHFSRGRDHARAVEYHARAAAAARERHATHEAAGHVAAAVEALAQAPVAPARAERELELVVTLAALQMAIRGYAAPETERSWARAAALCDALPASPARLPVLRGLVSYHHVRAQLREAYALGLALLDHAARHPDDCALGVQAHYGHGATLVHMGALASACEHLEIALRDYDPATHALHAHVYGGYDPAVGSSLWLAWALGLMGRLDEAGAREQAGLARARMLHDAFTLAWACHAAAVTRMTLGQWSHAEELSAEAVRLADEHGFPHVLAMATVNQGWAAIQQGNHAAGIPMLRRGIAAVEATGAALLRSSHLGMLATVEAIEGNAPAARRRIDEALAEVERSGERLHEATLLIDKAHVLHTEAGKRTEARAADECLERALEVARAQGAGLLALRAAVVLADRRRATVRGDEARALLVATYAPFAALTTDAPDLVAARRMLAALER